MKISVRHQAESFARLAERIILVEGGTFALSLPYVSALGSHLGASHVSLVPLQFGWVAMLGSIFLGFATWLLAIGVQAQFEQIEFAAPGRLVLVFRCVGSCFAILAALGIAGVGYFAVGTAPLLLGR